jgi:hypothetical protein
MASATTTSFCTHNVAVVRKLDVRKEGREDRESEIRVSQGGREKQVGLRIARASRSTEGYLIRWTGTGEMPSPITGAPLGSPQPDRFTTVIVIDPAASTAVMKP